MLLRLDCRRGSAMRTWAIPWAIIQCPYDIPCPIIFRSVVAVTFSRNGGGIQGCFIIFSISEIGGRNSRSWRPLRHPLRYNCNILITYLDLLSFRRLSLHFREMAAASLARQGCFVIFFPFQKPADETSLSEPSAVDPLKMCTAKKAFSPIRYDLKTRDI